MLRTDLNDRGDPVWVAIISTRRPKSVQRMQSLVGEATWYCSPDDVGLYDVDRIWYGEGLCQARNAALDHAFMRNIPCVQVSDDLMRMKILMGPPPRWSSTADTTFSKLVENLMDVTEITGAHLGGVNPTGNPFYCDPAKPIKEQHFVVGDFILVRPTHLRFDIALKLKEDYDYTAQHIAEYGMVARLDAALPQFGHRTEPGGAVDYRTARREQAAIATLQEKWPGVFRLNPKRENEIIMSGRKVPRNSNTGDRI